MPFAGRDQHHNFRHEDGQNTVIQPMQCFAPVLHQFVVGFQTQNGSVQKDQKNQSMLNPVMPHEGFDAVLPGTWHGVIVYCCHRYHLRKTARTLSQYKIRLKVTCLRPD